MITAERRRRDIVRLKHWSGRFVFATLYSVDGGWAYVKPNGHKHIERVRMSEVRPLKSRTYGAK